MTVIDVQVFDSSHTETLEPHTHTHTHTHTDTRRSTIHARTLDLSSHSYMSTIMHTNCIFY